VGWVRRYVAFHDRRHPRETGAPEFELFLNHLASERNVAASTHNQALSALLFLYGDVLGIELPWLGEIERPKRPSRLPVVLSRDEVRALLAQLDGLPALMAALLYGTGLRPMECVRLRVKDFDLDRGEILVRQGKGGKDRVTMVPRSLVSPLRRQLARARTSGGVITCKRSRCSARSSGRCARRGSPSRRPCIRRGTHSPPTCSSRATTSAPCRSSSAIATCRRR
jgi:integrase